MRDSNHLETFIQLSSAELISQQASRFIVFLPDLLFFMADHYDYLLKVVLIGDSRVICLSPLSLRINVILMRCLQVGKTSILQRHADDVFNETFIATIGVDFRVSRSCILCF